MTPQTRRDEIFDEYDSGLDAVDLPDDESDEDDNICPSCNGSGEGMYDGTTCRSCKGRGVSRAN